MLLDEGIAVASAFLIGFSTVLLLWPGIANVELFAVKAFLGLGIGQGITACSTFVFLLAFGSPDRSYCFVELCVLLVLGGLLVGKRRSRAAPMVHARFERTFGRIRYQWILAIAFCLAIALALATLVMWMQRAQYGEWDAWAIYNLRARWIYRAGYDWRDAFSGYLFRSHPDYPLLLPLSVVRAWMFAGNETMLAPKVIGGLFAAATIGLVPSAIALLRGRAQGCIAGVALLGNTFLIQHTSTQYADVPLMFFYAAALILLVLNDEVGYDKSSGRLLLAGLAAGLAAWTKNEGLMFVAVMLASHFAVVVHGSGWREYSRQLRLLVAGLLPVMSIFVYFKLMLAPPSDLAILMGRQSLVAKLADPSRYLAIASELGRRIVPHHRFGLGMACALALYALCMGLGARRTKGVALGALMLFLILVGYFAVYVVTPFELTWHMFTSIDRVLLQMWPIFVFVFFLIVATPNESFGHSGHQRNGAPQSVKQG